MPSAPTARPAVWVNCAVSLDGRLAYADGRPARLSGPEDLVRVHRMRAQAGAVLVGVGTVVRDDPSLRVRWELLGEPARTEPTRIVLDSSGRLPEGARVLDTGAPTIVATSQRSTRTYPPHVRRLVAGTDRVDVGTLFVRLAELGLRTVMVEGGARVLASVLRAGLFDRFTVYTAPFVIGGETAPAMVAGPETTGPEGTVPLDLVGVERLGAGHLATYGPRRPRAAPAAERSASGREA